MKKYMSLIIASLLCMSLFSQRIKIIEVKQLGEQIQIDYKVGKAKSYHLFDVELLVSLDNEASFEGPLVAVEGEIGQSMRRGRKTVYWNYFKERPFIQSDTNLTKTLVFDIRAKVMEEKRSPFFLSYSGNTITPYGIRFGGLGQTNVFVEVRTNKLFWEVEPTLTYTGQSINNYERSNHYYQFGDQRDYRSLSATFGLTVQLFRVFYIYFGGGYGLNQYLYQVGNYSYGAENLVDNEWVIDSRHSVEGVEVNAGCTLRLVKHLILSAGYVRIFDTGNYAPNGSFEYFTAGIGVCF